MASKKKIRRRVLGASCILAALIVAGASFAWFSSSDEVTNQLTATTDYGVSVVEDFTPPKDMTPGQEVNKDVAAVNTGSVGAFVRMSLDNSINMSVLSGTAVTDNDDATTNYYTDPTTGNLVTNPPAGVTTPLYSLTNFNITLPSATNLVELNPMESKGADGKTVANEVTTLMAGGQVVVAAGNSVAPDKQAVRSGDDVNNGFAVVYTNGTDKYVKDGNSWYKLENDPSLGVGVYKKAANAELTQPGGLTVDSLARDFSGNGQYQVQGSGLYLFRRTDNGTAKKYSGFYYDDSSKKFYKLATENNNNSAYVDATITEDAKGVVDSIANLKVLTLTNGITDATSGAAWSYTIGTLGANDEFTADQAGNYIQAVYKQTTLTNPGVVFFIKLADGWRTSWDFVDGMEDTAETAGSVGYFYYKNKLEAGQTSTKLIDSVKLSSKMKNSDFFDLTYDLKVKLDTVQVTKDQYGNETVEAVDSWTGIKATPNKTNGVITTVDWSEATP